MTRTLLVVASVAAALALVPGAALAVTANTIRVSVSSAGTEANNWSLTSDVSRYGRFVVFSSSATNLVGGDTNGVEDIFVHDRKTGKTRRVNISSSGAQANPGPLGSYPGSYAPAISGNGGRYVVFVSGAPNLVAGDTNGWPDIFVRDRALGTTERVSVSSAGAQANGLSWDPAISADGAHIAFMSVATNLVSGDTNAVDDVFVREAGKTRRVSISPAGAQFTGPSDNPSISADGNVVAFHAGWDVFVRVRSAHKTRRVSVSSAGVRGNDGSGDHALSANGRFVAFESLATNLVRGDTNNRTDVFVRDRLLGTTRRVSISSAEAQAQGPSHDPAISANGRYVAFSSLAWNLVPNDRNGSIADVFVRDRSAGTTRRVSVPFDGTQANGDSMTPEIAGSGRFVAFYSKATNLVAGDTNAVADVFLRGPLF